MVYHLHLRPEDIEQLSAVRIEQAIAAVLQIREQIQRQNES